MTKRPFGSTIITSKNNRMAFWKKAFAKQTGVHFPQAIVQGKPVETRADRDNAGKLSGPLQRLLDTVPHTTESNATT